MQENPIVVVPSAALSSEGHGSLCYLFIPLPHPPQVVDMQLRFHILLPVESNERHLGWQRDGQSAREERAARNPTARGINSSVKFSTGNPGPSRAHACPTMGEHNVAEGILVSFDYLSPHTSWSRDHC